MASVAIGAGGVLYGTTSGGGTYDMGVVFSLTPPASPGGPWVETGVALILDIDLKLREQPSVADEVSIL
jgi:uncharacterized repeat protein (TIGR03803 family)